MSGDTKKPTPIGTEARIKELEQTCEEQALAILRMYEVIEAHEKRLAVLELLVKNGNGTQNALREAGDLARRAAERRK